MLNLECGDSGDKPGCKVNCGNILERIKKADEEIAQLSSRVAKAEEKTENQRNAIMAQANKDVPEIEKGFSRDYLAGVDALSEIEKNKPHVATVERFILLFFIFVEILPLTLKITTPVGEYEYLRDTLLLDAKLNQDMEREIAKALFSDSNYKALSKIKFGHDTKRDEFLGITQIMLEFIKQMEENVKTYDRQIEEINRSINRVKDPRAREDHQLYLTDVKNLFNEALKKSSDRFLEYLKSL